MNPALRAILLTPRRAFAPVVSSLFAAGEKGIVVDPSYTRSMFQDAAMTIPAVVGMPVVKALDLSGNGKHATFVDVTLQQDDAGLRYLAFNGTSSYGSTAAIDFTGTDKMTVIAGARKISDAAFGMVAELSTDATNNGMFFLLNGLTSAPGPNWSFLSRGTASAAAESAASYTSPITNILTGVSDIGGDAATLRINGAQVATNAGDQGTGNFGNHALYIGARAGTSLFLNGRLYGLIVRGATSTAGQIADAERYMARLTGVNF